LEALHASAFLIDQNRSVAPPDRITELGDQASELVRMLDIAAEQNEAPRISLAQEAPLRGTQRDA
jgi:hypothetical protein